VQQFGEQLDGLAPWLGASISSAPHALAPGSRSDFDFACVVLYGATEPWFDKTWGSGEITFAQQMTITATGQSESCERLQDRREVREESEAVDYVQPNEPEAAVYYNTTRDGAEQSFDGAKHYTIRFAPYSIGSDRGSQTRR
jgi:hypothetical protein